MSEILGLKDTQIIILAYIAEYIQGEETSVELQQIIEQINVDRLILIDNILELKINNYIEQVGESEQGHLFWNHNKARYKINEMYKSEIETFLKYNLKENTVEIIGEYIWYATYGSGILQEKFLHYIQGGICRFNHTEYEGCKDTSLPLANRPITIPYKAYVGGSSALWQYKGTVFINSKQSGMTKGRMYLIKVEQYEQIRSQRGRGKEKYDEEIALGEYLGVPIRAVTNKANKVPNEASEKYKDVMEMGLKEIYKDGNFEQNKIYLDSLFDYQVRLNLDKEYLESIWKEEVRQIISEIDKGQLEKKDFKSQCNYIEQGVDDEPKQIITMTTVIKHNPLVVANRILKANGRCERCGKQSPYCNTGRGIDFLEVHYINAVEKGGKDELKNTIALCPNCKKEVEMGMAL